MKPLCDWSIRYKLTGLFVAMACLTAVTVALLLGTFDLLGLRRAMARDAAVLADVLARNSTATLSFRDPDAARDVLQALRADPTVTSACIYTSDGKPFATYVRDGNLSDFVAPPPELPGTRFQSNGLVLFRRITLGDEALGTIYIASDLHRLQSRLQEYAWAALSTLLVTLAVALLLASWLQRPISSPVLSLVKTAKAISTAGDYTIRATAGCRDEFGLLASEFNGMLDQVEKRDRELRSHREHLEEEVKFRTAELFSANSQLKLQAAALASAANSIVITDLEGRIVWTNPAFTSLSGYSAEEVLGENPKLLASGKHGKEFYAQMWSTITSGETWHGEVVNHHKSGAVYTEEMTITPVSLEAGKITHFIAIKQNITERKTAEQAILRAEEKYRAIFEDAVVGILQLTPEGRPLSINRAVALMHGYESPEQFLAEVTNVADQLFVDPAQLQDWLTALENSESVNGAEIQAYRRDRTKKWILANMRAVRGPLGEIVHLEGTIEDITDRKSAEQRVQYLAYYDALTGLPNRTLLEDRLEKAVSGARRRKEKLAVLFLDLDRFKIINDSLGHSVGDVLLQKVAKRLDAWGREQDTVARVGGDEFLIALNGIHDPSDVAVAVERLVAAINADFIVDGRPLNVSCSIGISLYPEHGEDAETLIKNADAAMYSAKDNGRNSYCFFTEEMNSQVVERLTLESNLRRALENDEFFLMYQPQVENSTGKIVGFEALLRWQHPEYGLVPPEKFIRIAENSGLIIPIGEWVLRTASAQARAWHEQGLPKVPVAVNVSAVQFRQLGFPRLIQTILTETGLAPEYLELELTESLLLSNADVTSQVLEELKSMGLRLAIDDFGTGYSSLSYLRQFPVNKLKIDRSFIEKVDIDEDDAAITAAIISMAKRLNLKVLAEGVETEAQISFLLAHQCDEAQGFYFSKPLTREQVTEKMSHGDTCSEHSGAESAGA